MKKCSIFFITLLCSNVILESSWEVGAKIPIGPVTAQTKTDVSSTIIFGTIALLLATKIGYDVSWNSTYAQKTNLWYQRLENKILAKNITSVYDTTLQSLFSPIDHDEMLQMHTWLNNSYNCWLTPWNWTETQKNSFRKVQLVEILTLYADLVTQKDQITGEQIVKAFRCKFGAISMYPLVFGYALIDVHLACIATHPCSQLSVLLREMTNHLNNFKILLRQEKDYQLDLQAKQTNDLQKEMINAIRSH